MCVPGNASNRKETTSVLIYGWSTDTWQSETSYFHPLYMRIIRPCPARFQTARDTANGWPEEKDPFGQYGSQQRNLSAKTTRIEGAPVRETCTRALHHSRRAAAILSAPVHPSPRRGALFLHYALYSHWRRVIDSEAPERQSFGFRIHLPRTPQQVFLFSTRLSSLLASLSFAGLLLCGDRELAVRCNRIGVRL